MSDLLFPNSATDGLNNNEDKNGEKVQVVVRLRPLNRLEQQRGDTNCVHILSTNSHGNAVGSHGNNDHEGVQELITGPVNISIQKSPVESQQFQCSNCLPSDTDQMTFFAKSGITNLIESAISGYRSCAFAFGQTGAGKTYTMVGGTNSIKPGAQDDGLIGRSIAYLFEKLNGLEASEVATGRDHYRYCLRLSCLEIYHENVFDLFCNEKERVPVNVREHATDGFFLEGIKTITCHNLSDAVRVVNSALRHRQIGSHDLNSRSSRSHCITDIYIDKYASTTSSAVPSLPSIVSNSNRNHSSNGLRSQSSSCKDSSTTEVIAVAEIASNEASVDQSLAIDREIGKPASSLNSTKTTEESKLEVEEGFLPAIVKPTTAARRSTAGTLKVVGKLSLVDLAGSERLKSTASAGKVLQEAGFINKSLYVLGKVIAGLVRTGGERNHKDVPYRDSKLTKLLIESLGGHSKTMLVACITESSISVQETIRTLKFSMSCARIKNKPVVMMQDQAQIVASLRDQIYRLKQENRRLKLSLSNSIDSNSMQAFPVASSAIKGSKSAGANRRPAKKSMAPSIQHKSYVLDDMNVQGTNQRSMPVRAAIKDSRAVGRRRQQVNEILKEYNGLINRQQPAQAAVRARPGIPVFDYEDDMTNENSQDEESHHHQRMGRPVAGEKARHDQQHLERVLADANEDIDIRREAQRLRILERKILRGNARKKSKQTLSNPFYQDQTPAVQNSQPFASTENESSPTVASSNAKPIKRAHMTKLEMMQARLKKFEDLDLRPAAAIEKKIKSASRSIPVLPPASSATPAVGRDLQPKETTSIAPELGSQTVPSTFISDNVDEMPKLATSLSGVKIRTSSKKSAAASPYIAHLKSSKKESSKVSAKFSRDMTIEPDAFRSQLVEAAQHSNRLRFAESIAADPLDPFKSTEQTHDQSQKSVLWAVQDDSGTVASHHTSAKDSKKRKSTPIKSLRYDPSQDEDGEDDAVSNVVADMVDAQDPESDLFSDWNDAKPILLPEIQQDVFSADELGKEASPLGETQNQTHVGTNIFPKPDYALEYSDDGESSIMMGAESDDDGRIAMEQYDLTEHSRIVADAEERLNEAEEQILRRIQEMEDLPGFVSSADEEILRQIEEESKVLRQELAESKMLSRKAAEIQELSAPFEVKLEPVENADLETRVQDENSVSYLSDSEESLRTDCKKSAKSETEKYDEDDFLEPRAVSAAIEEMMSISGQCSRTASAPIGAPANFEERTQETVETDLQTLDSITAPFVQSKVASNPPVFVAQSDDSPCIDANESATSANNAAVPKDEDYYGDEVDTELVDPISEANLETVSDDQEIVDCPPTRSDSTLSSGGGGNTSFGVLPSNQVSGRFAPTPRTAADDRSPALFSPTTHSSPQLYSDSPRYSSLSTSSTASPPRNSLFHNMTNSDRNLLAETNEADEDDDRIYSSQGDDPLDAEHDSPRHNNQLDEDSIRSPSPLTQVTPTHLYGDTPDLSVSPHAASWQIPLSKDKKSPMTQQLNSSEECDIAEDDHPGPMSRYDTGFDEEEPTSESVTNHTAAKMKTIDLSSYALQANRTEGGESMGGSSALKVQKDVIDYAALALGDDYENEFVEE